jgi:hypothetical protein
MNNSNEFKYLNAQEALEIANIVNPSFEKLVARYKVQLMEKIYEAAYDGMFVYGHYETERYDLHTLYYNLSYRLKYEFEKIGYEVHTEIKPSAKDLEMFTWIFNIRWVNGIKEDNLTVKLNMDDMSKILREYPSLMKDGHKDE